MGLASAASDFVKAHTRIDPATTARSIRFIRCAACRSDRATTQAPLAPFSRLRHSLAVNVRQSFSPSRLSLQIATLALGFVLSPLHRASAAEDGEDWPRFLGPRANNISAESGLLDKW